jgi:hypothetical protein
VRKRVRTLNSAVDGPSTRQETTPMKLASALTVTATLLSTACVVHEDHRPPPPPPANTVVVVQNGGGAHPAYLHALSDLRNARANIERKGGDPQMKWDEHDAIAKIDRAIGDIKQASIDDGKNLDDHPPVDAREPRVGRLHKGLAALQAARADIEKEEDNAYANGLRNRANQDVVEAIQFTDAGIQAAAQAQ